MMRRSISLLSSRLSIRLRSRATALSQISVESIAALSCFISASSCTAVLAAVVKDSGSVVIEYSRRRMDRNRGESTCK